MDKTLIAKINVATYIKSLVEKLVDDSGKALPDIIVWFIKWLEGKKIIEFIEGVLIPLTEDIFFPNVDIYKVNYPSKDPTLQKEIKLSGLLIIPNAISATKSYSFPIAGYQHGTTMERKKAPSCFDIENPFNTFEVIVGILFAGLYGYIVAMADYQGMGDDNDHIQPYVCTEPLAFSVADLLLETKKDIEKNQYVSWNNQTYLIGYSQGGYVTMSAARKLTEDPYKQLNLKASTPCAGPHSLSEVMRFLMLRKEKFPAGYFLPMTIRGFNAMYGDGYDKWFTRERSIKKEYYEVWDKSDGNYPSNDVQKLMPAIPCEILTDDFIAQLSQKDGMIYKVLQNNNSYTWDIPPGMQMRLFHSPHDDLVPYENSVVVYQYFKEKGYDVQLSPAFFIPLGIEIHVEAAFSAFLSAYIWLNSIRDEHSVLERGDFLFPGQSLASVDKRYCMRYQLDGKLSLYNLENDALLWKAPFDPVADTGPYICVLSRDNGKLMVFDLKGNSLWKTDNDKPGNKVLVSNEGKVIILDDSGTIVWSSP